MKEITILLFIFVQLAQGYIYKCGDAITVKRGEKRHIRFWVEEGELLKLDKAKIKVNEQFEDKHSLFSKEIQEKHPFIEQHIAILNRLSDMELSQNKIQLPKVRSHTDGEMPLQSKHNVSNENSEIHDDKSLPSIGKQKLDNVQEVQFSNLSSINKESDTNTYSKHAKADEDLLKIIKQKELDQLAKNHHAPQSELSKNETTGSNKRQETEDMHKEAQIKTMSDILNLFHFDTKPRPNRVKYDSELLSNESTTVKEQLLNTPFFIDIINSEARIDPVTKEAGFHKVVPVTDRGHSSSHDQVHSVDNNAHLYSNEDDPKKINPLRLNINGTVAHNQSLQISLGIVENITTYLPLDQQQNITTETSIEQVQEIIQETNTAAKRLENESMNDSITLPSEKSHSDVSTTNKSPVTQTLVEIGEIIDQPVVEKTKLNTSSSDSSNFTDKVNNSVAGINNSDANQSGFAKDSTVDGIISNDTAEKLLVTEIQIGENILNTLTPLVDIVETKEDETTTLSNTDAVQSVNSPITTEQTSHMSGQDNSDQEKTKNFSSQESATTQLHYNSVDVTNIFETTIDPNVVNINVFAKHSSPIIDQNNTMDDDMITSPKPGVFSDVYTEENMSTKAETKINYDAITQVNEQMKHFDIPSAPKFKEGSLSSDVRGMQNNENVNHHKKENAGGLAERQNVQETTNTMKDSEITNTQDIRNKNSKNSDKDNSTSSKLSDITRIHTKSSSISHSDNKNIEIQIRNKTSDLYVDPATKKIDATGIIFTKKEESISSFPEKGKQPDKHDFSENAGNSDGTSIRIVHQQYVDVKPELFEIRNIVSPIKSDYNLKEQVNNSKFNPDLLTAINDYPIDTSVDETMHLNNNAQVNQDNVIPMKYITTTTDIIHLPKTVDNNKMPSAKNRSTSTISNQISQSVLEEGTNVPINDTKLLVQKNAVIIITKQNNTESKKFDAIVEKISSTVPSPDDPKLINPNFKSNFRVDMDINKIEVILEQENKTDKNKIISLVPDIIDGSIVESNENLEDETKNPDYIKTPEISDESQTILKHDLKGINENKEKIISEESQPTKTEPNDSDIKNNSTAYSMPANGEKDDHSKTPVSMQMITYDVLNSESLSNIENTNEKAGIVIKETGMKVSIAKPIYSNGKDNNIKYTNNLANQESVANIIRENIVKLQAVNLEKHHYITSDAESTIKDGHTIENPTFIHHYEGISVALDANQSTITEHSNLLPDVNIFSQKLNDEATLEDLKQIIKLQISENNYLLGDDIRGSAQQGDDYTDMVDGDINNLSGYNKYEEGYKKTEKTTTIPTTINDLLLIHSNILIPETSTKIPNETTPPSELYHAPNMPDNDTGSDSKIKLTKGYLNGDSEIDDILNPPITDLGNGFEFIIPDRNNEGVNDVIGETVDTTTNGELYSDLINDDPLADLIQGINRPPSSENKESVIDMIKDFIFSIPQYSNSNNDKLSPANLLKNDHYNELNLENGNFDSKEELLQIKPDLISNIDSASAAVADKLINDREKYIVHEQTDILQQRKGPANNFDFTWKDIQSRRDDSPTYYGGDNPFFIKLPGSPNTVPVFLQYEPVKIKYVPVEKLKKSEGTEDFLSKLDYTEENKDHSSMNSPNNGAPKSPNDNSDPFFIINSPNLADNFHHDRISQTEQNKEMLISIGGKLSLEENDFNTKLIPNKSEILYPGKSNDVEAYSSIDTQSLTNLVFEMGPKLSTPPTREPNPQYTPFPLTTNPPFTHDKKHIDGIQITSMDGIGINTTPSIGSGTPSTVYSPVPSISFNDTEATTYNNEDPKSKGNELLPRENIRYRSPQRSALHKANNLFPPAPTRPSAEENFDVVALANFLHQSQKGWTDTKPLSLPTVGSWRDSSWEDFKYATESEDDSWKPTRDFSPWLKIENDSRKHYEAFYAPEDIPGMDPALFSYRKNTSSLRQPRELDIASLKTYISNLPLPMKKAILSPSTKHRSRRYTFLGEPTICEWNIKSDPNLYLVVTFHKLSAEFTVDCQGAYIEIERENNGFEARWCGHRAAMDTTRSHVIFAKSNIQITAYDNGDTNKKMTTGFEADVEAIDLSKTEEYAALALSNAQTHLRKMRLSTKS